MDFVADAYGSFVDEYNFRNQTNPDFLNDEMLSPRGISPVQGWISVSQIHHQYVQNFYNKLVENILPGTAQRRQVRTFEQFVLNFLDFFDHIGTSNPFTRTGLINGLASGPLISGLCIELSAASHSSDNTKHLDFYQNPFYYIYRLSLIHI